MLRRNNITPSNINTNRFTQGLYIVGLFLAAIWFSFDLFTHTGRPATYDGPTHLTTIAQFYSSLSLGEFPVRWLANFTPYGSPISQMSHQLTSYLGAVIMFATHQVETSFNLVVLLGAVISNLTCYLFLRRHTHPFAAFIGTLFFNFTAYRINNIYLRGALPEFFATTFVPVLLIGINDWISLKRLRGLYLMLFAVIGIFLTHPMVIVPSLIMVFPYFLWLVIDIKPDLAQILPPLIFTSILALCCSAYYLVPLFGEIKYFYYGTNQNHFRDGEFLNFSNYFDPSWYYFKTGTHPGPRGNFNKFGLIETVIIVVSIITTIKPKLLTNNRSKQLMIISFGITAIILIFLTTSYSNSLYQHLPLLNGLQYPWRMLTGLIFIPPIFIALLIDRYPHQKFWSVFIVFFILVRAPQIYGKNYLIVPASVYFSTPVNLHAELLNTIWMGATNTYAPRHEQATIIEGQGKLVITKNTNNIHEYLSISKESLRLVDYTFYFPGWQVEIDDQPVTIEFQDPKYRGIITFVVPSGNHHIVVRYSDTKIRLFGKIVTLFGIITTPFLFLLHPKLSPNAPV